MGGIVAVPIGRGKQPIHGVHFAISGPARRVAGVIDLTFISMAARQDRPASRNK
jgi:hypothetical protein